MLLTTAFATVSCLAASELTLDKVAPEQTVLAVSFEDLGDLMKRFDENADVKKMSGQDVLMDFQLDGMLRGPMDDAFQEMMEESPSSSSLRTCEWAWRSSR